METSLDLSHILIPENINMQDSVYDAICGDIVWKIMDKANLATRLSSIRNHLEGYGVKVAPELFGWLYDILCDVQQSLKIEGEIDLYIVNNNESNAFSYTPIYQDETPIIVINSGLIDRLSREELHFVIGHEIGHLIAKHSALADVLDFLYNDEKPQPGILQKRMMLITQLSELEADRFGYIAMPDMRVCASAMFKLQSGVDPKFSQTDIDKFLCLNKEKVDYLMQEDGTSTLDHPADPIRIEAIRLFSKRESLPEEEYRKAMYELYDVHTKLLESELESNIGLFVAAGGLLICRLDGDISSQELDRICSMLSGYYMFPLSILSQLMEEEDKLQETFENATKQILEKDSSYKLSLLRYLAGFLASDEYICENEVDFVMNCGTTLLGLSEEEVIEVIAETLKEDFKPSHTRLASLNIGEDEEGNQNNENIYA